MTFDNLLNPHHHVEQKMERYFKPVSQGLPNPHGDSDDVGIMNVTCFTSTGKYLVRYGSPPVFVDMVSLYAAEERQNAHLALLSTRSVFLR